MADITVIVLTKNEEKNIAKCIESAWQIADRVLVIDCGSEDGTVAIAAQNGAEVYYHEWMGHAAQFNWALDNCNITTDWVFRLDADERITKELAQEIIELDSTDYDAFELRWQMYFMGKRLKYGGTHKTYVTRLIRYGKARVDDKAMDERFVVEGKTGKLKNDFIHYDYKGLDSWITKHIVYSNLELATFSGVQQSNTIQQQKRGFYYKLPLFIRAKLYFLYRYFVQLGFLDGTPGRVYIYLQAYWYRFLVDAKIYEMEHK